MRSLIILRGLSKSDKESWLRKEKLVNFSIELEALKKLYYKPEYKGGRDFLVRSMDDIVYRRMIEILLSRMNGSLVVLDWGMDSTVAIEQLCKIMGYTVFYKIFPVPRDYISDQRKYQDSRYLPKSKEQLENEVRDFKSQDYTGKNIINSYKDLENYWNKITTLYKLGNKGNVLHISDVHSHWTVLQDIILPKIDRCLLTVFLGDYIDGPDPMGSRQTIEYVLQENRDNILFIEGNHEARLRKYLGWKALKGNKRILSETLFNDIPPDFLEQTAPQFEDLTASDAWRWIDELNNKFLESVVYERFEYKFICSHCGLKWVDQLCPKYIGSLLSTNKHIEKVDEFFSKKFTSKRIWSIHGHCHYVDYEFNKFPGIFNLDPPDENKVILMEGRPGMKFNIRCLEQDI